MNAAARRRPDLRFIVRTSVPRWVLEASAQVPLDVQPLETDTGVVQIDGLRLDEEETARRAARVYRDFDERIAAEAAWLAAARRALDLDEGELVVLASFGAYGLDLPYGEIARRSRFTLIVTPHEIGAGAAEGGRLRRVTPQPRSADGLRYEDLVAAADVVVSKPRASARRAPPMIDDLRTTLGGRP